ncbi:nitrite reductase small subunit NirD [Lihuaxuella thermophila]|uniref:Nitrite reductase (NADH) small subunit n=1 Tax=Lihuaxuella thermophila TaxID=1173111 RepID=A0A1H8IPK9_9BACL|nr:nitrite reductase small subunit NirD [Lihuaxuella thermophila]SEN69618.1 nitrite reductase (NADH) small subunit [Lihuaxuella thermophila]
MYRIKVAVITELQEKIGKTVEVDGQEIALFRLSDGKIRAVENRCPHKGGTLSEGIVSGEYVFCPLHDWKICLNDGLVQAPDTGCVKTYEVMVEGQDVYIRV